jgi:uncharacterized coiled-coil protein SlyX
VPEWVEKCCHGMEMPSSWTAVYEGLAALRADRDRWRERAMADLSKDDPCVPGEPQSVSRDDLEYRWLSQRKTIHGYQNDLSRHTDRIAELEAHALGLECQVANQIKTIDNLTARKYPTVEQVNRREVEARRLM